MANPEFDATDLTTHAPREVYGSPIARVYAETLPDTDGAFVQPHGYGGRTIHVTGVYIGTASATGDAAAAALKAAIRTMQQNVGSEAIFSDQHGVSHTNCVLASYMQTGQMSILPPDSDDKVSAIVNVAAVILDPTP